MTVSVSAGIIKLISPSGGLKKEIGFAVAVASLFSLILPITNAFKEGLPDIELDAPSFESISFPDAEDGIISAAADLICRELEYTAEKKYGVENASVSIVINAENASAIEIASAEISGKGGLSRAAEYISELLGCPVGVKEEE